MPPHLEVLIASLVRRTPGGARRRQQGGRRKAWRCRNAHQHLLESQVQGQSCLVIEPRHYLVVTSPIGLSGITSIE